MKMTIMRVAPGGDEIRSPGVIALFHCIKYSLLKTIIYVCKSFRFFFVFSFLFINWFPVFLEFVNSKGLQCDGRLLR